MLAHLPPVVGDLRGGPLPPGPQVGGQLRAAARSALRGSRDHLHRPGPGPRPGAALVSTFRVDTAPAPPRAGDRPRADAEGPRIPARRVGTRWSFHGAGAAADGRTSKSGDGRLRPRRPRKFFHFGPDARRAEDRLVTLPSAWAASAFFFFFWGGGGGGELIALAAREDPRVVAITAGMPTGTGLDRFGAAFPGRFFDVGIAEHRAMTLATGLALGGAAGRSWRLYSTFLQRAFDQVVHDVCQNDQPVVIGVDRAGLVGEDGTSHQGMFTIPAQRQLPNLVVASPKDEQELRRLVRMVFAQDHPFAIRYPRDRLRRARAQARDPPGRPRRGSPGGDRPPAHRVRADCPPRRGSGRRPGRRGLVGRRDERPVRQAPRPPAHPRPGAGQASRGDPRGEHDDRRLQAPGVLEALEEARLVDGGLQGCRPADHRHPGRPLRRSPARSPTSGP